MNVFEAPNPNINNGFDGDGIADHLMVVDGDLPEYRKADYPSAARF